MGKLILPLIIGLLMGVSGGGFFAVVQAGKAHASAVADAQKRGLKPAGDSTHAATDSAGASDSTAHGEGDHAATETASATPTGGAALKLAPDNTHAPETHAATTPKPGTTPVAPAPAPPVSHAAPSDDDAAKAAATQAHQRRLAKIFATMGPKDAARVLAQMTDHDVEIILGLLSDRQAAAILINLPPPRAAVLSHVQPRLAGSVK